MVDYMDDKAGNPISAFVGVWIVDARNHLNTFVEGLNNGLACESASLVEEYKRGRASVVVYLNVSPPQRRYGYHPPLDDPNKGDSSHVMVLVYNHHICKTGHGEGRHKQSVLVDVIDVREFPYIALPSLVRLYFVENELRDFRSGLKYLSVFKGTLNIVPFGPFREIHSIVRNDTIRDMIESPLQVVDDVTDNDGNVIWRAAHKVDFQEVLTSARLMLDVDFAEICLPEVLHERIKLLDVAVGPLDFQS